MNAPTRNSNRNTKAARKPATQRSINTLLPALLAVGGATGIIANPAFALELGALQIDSTLGQPLRASITYALNPHEELYDFCVSLNKAPANGLQTLTRARISISNNQILLRGSKAINEPMLTMRVTVNCPYTAHLARDYVVMVNPPGSGETVATAKSPAAVANPQAIPPQVLGEQAAQPTEPAASKAATSAVADKAPRQSSATPLQIGSDYRVKRGDTLSAIASRIVDRPLDLWAAVDALFLANPDAFVDGDRNQLKAGSLLRVQLIQAAGLIANVGFTPVSPDEADAARTVDDFANSNAPTAVTDTGVADRPVISTALASDNDSIEVAAAYDDDTAVLASGTSETSSNSTAGLSQVDGVTPNTEQNIAALTPIDKVATARPGDVFAAIPAGASLEATEVPSIGIPDTQIVAQPASAPVVSGSKTDTGNDSWSWLIWLGGSGVALILGLLLFGRKIRDRFGDHSSQVTANTGDSDEITQEAKVLPDIDFNFDATGSDSYPMELDTDLSADFDQSGEIPLDADLGSGTGLQAGVKIDVANDFGFSASGDNQLSQFDLEITADAAAEPAPEPTDIIPPPVNLESSILDSETPPDEDEGFSQYDLSMIVDATKHSDGMDAGTAKDLQAVQIGPGKQDRDSKLSDAADFMILEQDYEDELTATQAVNKEIAKAALELSNGLDEKDVPDLTIDTPVAAGDAADDLTSRLPLADDANLTAELTAEMPLVEEANLTTELTAEVPLAEEANLTAELTAEVPLAEEANLTAELTAELPADTDAVNEDFISDLDDTGISAELTAKLPQGNDLTVELEIESGTVDTKKVG